tara:strand:+ start:27130 stop:27636 length:507 start_codon:yes stop_codon:yes gene_type:complete
MITHGNPAAWFRNSSSGGRCGTTSRLSAFAAALFLVFNPTATSAHSYELGDLTVGHIWAPQPVDGSVSIPIYAGVLNSSSKPISLVGATTSVAGTVRIRKAKNGSVRWPEAIKFEPGRPFALAPWREHLWVTGLKRLLGEGDSFDLTLDFGSAGTLDVTVVIESEAGH